MSLRRTLPILAALAVLLVTGGYSAYWFHVAAQLRKGIEGWAEERRADGWRVGWDDLSVGGFPSRVTARLARPLLTSPGGWHWDTGALTADASPFDLTRVRLDAPGGHNLSQDGQTLTATAAQVGADLDLDSTGRLEVASAIVGGLTIAAEGGEGVSVSTLAMIFDPLAVEHPTHDTATINFSASAQGIGLPAGTDLVLGREIALAEVSGRLMGPLPPGPPLPALAVWSGNGGTIEIDRFAMDWEPMGIEANGTLAFDPALQPLAALSAKVRGFGPLMDRLAQRGMVDQGAASAAKLLLALMARPDARGRPSVPMPLTLQDGTLFLGPAKVGQVPPIQWAEPEVVPVPR